MDECIWSGHVSNKECYISTELLYGGYHTIVSITIVKSFGFSLFIRVT